MSEQPPTLSHLIHHRLPGDVALRDDLTRLMEAIAEAGKTIDREVNRAGLVDILGLAGQVNIQGEEVAKLDLFTNDVVKECLAATGLICVMGSEEDPGPTPVTDSPGGYVALFDPLDGSSNIDVGAPIGTIFSLHRRRSESGPGTLADLLQKGEGQVAAGYIMYGSSTMLVLTWGDGVYAFTLDPETRRFLLHGEKLTFPAKSRIYSINESNSHWWHPPVSRWVEQVKSPGGGRTARYIGSLLADFHRNLLRGGIFAYPADTRDAARPNGKLRLLYEASPLALVAEQAGGAASDGTGRILDIEPTDLHQRTPLFIGNRADVEAVEKLHRQD